MSRLRRSARPGAYGVAVALFLGGASCGRTPLRATERSAGGGDSCSEAICAAPLVCCGSACVDLRADPSHCGACDAPCPGYAHAAAVCAAGACAMGACEPGHADCNGSPADGCEIEAPTGACECTPGATEPCYDGPAGTLGVAACKGGVRTCAPSAAWGACEGEIVPTPEACNGQDDDCDGQIDFTDADGDGWTPCDGDCCDQPGGCGADPTLVNPGAFDIPGNGVDDDCDPATGDGGPASCDPAPLTAPTGALALARAMDLCQTTTEDPPLADRRWGLITASLLLADGSEGPPADVQAGVLERYGTVVVPQQSNTMAALSSGTARDEGDPGFVHPENGVPGQLGNFDAGTTSGVPPAWLAANGGTQPPPVSCPPCTGVWCTEAHDSVDLELRVRVPTNAASLSFRHRFYTAEYPDFACLPGPDRFVALLSGGAPTCGPGKPAGCIPADGNIAFDSLQHPISANDAFYEVCVPKGGAPPDACPAGASDLLGTGMGGWNGSLADGAATAWLDASAPVVPGETIELELVIWDGTDHNVDSLVLVDAFAWHP